MRPTWRTFSRYEIFHAFSLNATQLQKAFADWMKACHEATDGAVVAIDGKTLRGSYCRGKDKAAIHMVSAFSTANNGVVLGQIKTEDKSNEITAIPELLKQGKCMKNRSTTGLVALYQKDLMWSFSSFRSWMIRC